MRYAAKYQGCLLRPAGNRVSKHPDVLIRERGCDMRGNIVGGTYLAAGTIARQNYVGVNNGLGILAAE